MRISCTSCQGRATIRSSRHLSATYRQLYCICNNPHCGHTFVLDVTFSHTLSPSSLDIPDSLLARIREKGGPNRVQSLFEGI